MTPYIIIGIVFVVFCIVALTTTSPNKKTTDLARIPFEYRKIEDVPVAPELNETKEILVNAIKGNKELIDIDYNAVYAKIKSANDDDYDFLNGLYSNLIARGSYSNLDMLTERFSKYNSNVKLNARESVLYRNKSASVYTIQRIITEVNFCGNKVYSGPLRAGNGYVRTRDVEGMRFKDNGILYVTNLRVLFVAEKGEVISIPFSYIVDDALYEDNGVILKIENSKPVVFALNANFLYNKETTIADDSRLEAFNVIDVMVHK